MKRIGAILSLALIVVLLSAPLCFAGTLEVVNSYPKEGQSDLQNVNCGVKVYFNEKIYTKETADINKNSFKIVNEKGKAVPTTVIYGTKEENMIMVLAKSDLEVNTGYSLKISDDLVAANGDTLAKPVTISFKTRDTSKDAMVNMVMMGVMVVGMIFFTSKATKKQMQKQQAESAAKDKVNPYKVAKETGKSVEEIVAKDQKEKQKKAKAEERKRAKQEAAKASGKTTHVEQEISSENKRVKGPRPISAGGSTYITGRKAKAEKEAAAKAAAKAKGTTNPKTKKGKTTKKK